MASSSSKASRTPGTPFFEKYTLVKEVGGVNCGLLPIPYSRFTRVIDTGAIEEDHEGILPFSYVFRSTAAPDAIQTYKSWVVSTAGTLILSRDPGKLTLDSIGTWDTINVVPEDRTLLLSPWIGYTKVAGGVATEGYDWPLANEVKGGIWYLETTSLPGGPAAVWRFYMTNELGTDILEYEIVVYESGRIEYRYEPLPKFATSAGNEIGAAIGIWYANHTFRDYLVEYTPQRSTYPYGGAVYSAAYTNPEYGTPYYSSARSGTHWPGGYAFRARYVYEPQRLPDRRTARKKSGERWSSPSRSRGTRVGSSLYNDALTPVFGTTNQISFPTGVPRLYGHGSSVHFAAIRSGLFSGDITFTGSVTPEATNPIFPTDETSEKPDPFSESFIYESGSSKYASLTVGNNYSGADLRGVYSNKTVIQKDFAIQFMTTFPLTSSCMAIFSVQSGSFNYSRQHLGNVLANGLSNVNNDPVGFSPFGYYVASGSTASTTPGLGTTYTDSTSALQLVADSSQYDKMIGVNPDYHPLAHHLWDIPVRGPYMLEALEISLPIAAGPTWFRDMTSATGVSPGIPNAPEYGGPAVTYSIWRVRDGVSIDLVHSGTITHVDDARIKKVTYGVWGAGGDYYYELKGFQYFGGSPSGVVVPLTGASGPYFTGSVSAISKTTVSSGLFYGLNYPFNGGDLPGLTGFFSNDRVTPVLQRDDAGFAATKLYVGSITPFTKCGTSGSIVDSRHPHTSGWNYLNYLDGRQEVLNPIIDPDFVSYLNANLGSTVTHMQGPVVCNMVKTQESPYLVLPGDRFVLYLSKCHPALTGTDYVQKGRYYNISGGQGHHFSVITGSLSMRFYGSYVRAGREYVL